MKFNDCNWDAFTSGYLKLITVVMKSGKIYAMKAVDILGHTKDCRDDNDTEPEGLDVDWDELSHQEQKDAVSVLGYDMAKWDGSGRCCFCFEL
mmetsp:Transcript_2758/g.3255  ORF Transcript_2758/g.3255 Transcript_2758/m.3255 type:complete len:93 (+) Transcript_2758:121-399(+)